MIFLIFFVIDVWMYFNLLSIAFQTHICHVANLNKKPRGYCIYKKRKRGFSNLSFSMISSMPFGIALAKKCCKQSMTKKIKNLISRTYKVDFANFSKFSKTNSIYFFIFDSVSRRNCLHTVLHSGLEVLNLFVVSRWVRDWSQGCTKWCLIPRAPH